MEVGIRTLTVSEAEEYFRDATPEMLVLLGTVDPETHELVFTEDDIDLIREMEAGFGVKLRLEIQRFNGFLSEEDDDEGK